MDLVSSMNKLIERLIIIVRYHTRDKESDKESAG